MAKIRYVRITFAQQLQQQDIPKFRAAVIEKTNREASLFHNHKEDTSVIYRYPLIQYKTIFKNANIICLNMGTEDIHYLLKHEDLNLRIGRKEQGFPISSVDLHYHELSINKGLSQYQITNWLALNQKHHQRYRELADDKAAQKSLLESILIGNILAFAKGVDWQIEERVLVNITNIQNIKPMFFKRKQMPTFTLTFSCNVDLPNFIGLGKGTSIGFGVIKQDSQN